jgi:hypothetical protein
MKIFQYMYLSYKSILRNLDYKASYKHFVSTYVFSTRFKELPINANDQLPMLLDKTKTTSFDRHYVYHTAWAARKLAELQPSEHVDIGSHHYFAALVSSFIPFHFYDFRPAPINLQNLEVGQANLTNLIFNDNSISSLSCMHVVEHIGLGRYGDPIDPDGDLKAMDELIRVLAPSGMLLFVVPVGKPRICFNAHRIYDPEWIKSYFDDRFLRLEEFAIITDDGSFLRMQTPESFRDQIYACGCYAFKKVHEN